MCRALQAQKKSMPAISASATMWIACPRAIKLHIAKWHARWRPCRPKIRHYATISSRRDSFRALLGLTEALPRAALPGSCIPMIHPVRSRWPENSHEDGQGGRKMVRRIWPGGRRWRQSSDNFLAGQLRLHSTARSLLQQHNPQAYIQRCRGRY